MAAYVVVDTVYHDAELAARYRELAAPSVERHGGRYLVRGGPMHLLEGDWLPHRLVVLEFPSVDAARQWYDSPEYGEARAVRAGSTEFQMFIVDGA